MSLYSCPEVRQTLIDFRDFFQCETQQHICDEVETLKTPPRVKRVATRPCVNDWLFDSR